MKTIKILFLILFSAGFFAQNNFAQDLDAYKFIGKRIEDVRNHYGKPIHIEDSNPSMVCIFYKKDKNTMTFVSDENSIFQADVLVFYETKNAAKTELNKVVSQANQQSFAADTLSSMEFKLKKEDVAFDIAMAQDPNSTKYEISIHAKRN